MSGHAFEVGDAVIYAHRPELRMKVRAIYNGGMAIVAEYLSGGDDDHNRRARPLTWTRSGEDFAPVVVTAEHVGRRARDIEKRVGPTASVGKVVVANQYGVQLEWPSGLQWWADPGCAVLVADEPQPPTVPDVPGVVVERNDDGVALWVSCGRAGDEVDEGTSSDDYREWSAVYARLAELATQREAEAERVPTVDEDVRAVWEAVRHANDRDWIDARGALDRLAAAAREREEWPS